MTRSQLVAVIVVVTQAVIAYLLSQTDVSVPPLLKVALGAASVGLNAFALFLKIQPAPPAVEVPGGGKPVVGDPK